jgi:hypothetical protein
MVALFSLTIFDFSENWHNWQKPNIYFLFRQKRLTQKNYRVTNFSIFHDFFIILSLITQRVFIAKICAWYLLKRYFIEQNSKNKKSQQKFKKNWFR